MHDQQMQDENMLSEKYQVQQNCADTICPPNIILTVKNIDNLDEYSLKTYLIPDYIPKLQKWIDKNKYRVEESMDDIYLRV